MKQTILILMLVGCMSPRIVAAEIAGSVPAGTFAPAENDGLAQPHTGAAVNAEGVEALLHQVVRQVTAGHTVSPEGDNAMSTWTHLLDLLEATMPPSPATLRALTDFATDAQRRAADEQAAGRLAVARDLTVFARQAVEVLQLAPASSSAPMPALAGPVEDAPPAAGPADIATGSARSSEPPGGSARSAAPRPNDIDLAQAQMPSAGSVGTDASMAMAALNKETVVQAPSGGTAAAPSTAPAASAPSHPSAVLPDVTLPPHLEVKAQTAQEKAAAAAMASRGDAMLAIKDVSAARAFYGYAANAGNARAATALAETYDPAFLNRLGVIGPKPNPTLAAEWYRKAAALGDRSADARLRTLEAEAAK